MNSDSVSQLLYEAANLLALGMVFVFLFLTLLIGGIKVIAVFCQRYPGDTGRESISPTKSALPNTSQVQLNPSTIAAITAAVHKYRQQHHKNKG